MSLETTKEKIIKNNERISELLRENEELLRKEGFELPNENFVVGDWYKIKIPSGYIRNTTYFYEKYHLDSIVKEWQVRANIAYSFQLSDFYNYLFNRFNIWGSVVIIFYKNAIINLVSIFEALILECANNICECPSECQRVTACKLHFSKEARNNSYMALARMNALGIISYSEEKMARIKEIIGLRNRVHIRLAEKSEFSSADFCLELHDEVIALIQELSEAIYNNGVKFYSYCNQEKKL